MIRRCLTIVADPKLNRRVVAKAVDLVQGGLVQWDRVEAVLQAIVDIRREAREGIGPGFTRGPAQYFSAQVSRWPEYQALPRQQATQPGAQPEAPPSLPGVDAVRQEVARQEAAQQADPWLPIGEAIAQALREGPAR